MLQKVTSNTIIIYFCGDFNFVDGNSVESFLVGKQSLYREEVAPVWEDLGAKYQNATNIKLLASLDLLSNPRWEGNVYKDCAFYEDFREVIRVYGY